MKGKAGKHVARCVGAGIRGNARVRLGFLVEMNVKTTVWICVMVCE